MATVKLFYPKAQQQMEGREEVEVVGSTVGECLADLFRRYPGAQRFIVDGQGRLLEPVCVYVNQESAAKAAMDAPVTDKDSLIIAFLVTGG
jgi:hypothetical protein